ncbi:MULTISPECIES: YceI family protein [Niastella]|uniref:YceI family protein n=1 Tax=Niastella soli TaxID=2821487 RepID=A0ABS3YVS2_9BACT|nr:YceI family protein [Niastella soli]MBO9201627.1 YceI family protein [Niastella soli]
MKKIIVFILGLFLTFPLFSQSLTPIDTASEVTFKIKNLGFNTSGSFSGLAGAITFTPDNPDGCSFDVHIDANTVNTGVEMRDDHLRGSDYFDVKNHPQIRFVSAKVTSTKKNGTLFVSGKLTIKGTTKDISFPFTAQPIKDGYLFNGEFKINRRDFKVGGGSTVSDNLTVFLKVVARKI